MKRTTGWIAGVAVSVMWLGGCGSDFLPAPEPQPVAGPEAYRIGVLDGPLGDELEEGMQLTPLTGTASDKPIVIAASALDTITTDQTTAMNAAYAAGQPLILVYAGLEDILGLQKLLGNDSFEYDLPDGDPYVEIYAIDREADGSMWQWSLAPPESLATQSSETTDGDLAQGTEASSETPEELVSLADDNDANQNSRAALLIQWVAENGQRMELEAPSAQAAKLQLAQAAGPKEELTEIGAAWIDQRNFQQYGNNYQVSNFAWRCHSIADNQDWFYVQQRCSFYAGGDFTTNATRHKGWYLSSVEMDAWMDGYDNKPADVGLVESSPQTANNQTQVTSGLSWTIGGEIGYDQTNGFAGKVNGGVTISNSTTVNVSDCTVLNKSNDRGNNPHWIYQFRRSESNGNIEPSLTAPPDLAITTFQPTNQWIWRMVPGVRTKGPAMKTTCRVTLEDTQGTWDFLWHMQVKRDYQQVRESWSTRIPFPPNQ